MTAHVASRAAGSRPAATRRVSAAAQTASWPALLAWGAGLILVAIGAGAIVGSAETPTLSRVAGAVLVPLGLLALAWGAVALSRGYLFSPRAVVAGAMTGVLIAVTALAVDPAGVSIASVAAASVLLIVLGVFAAAASRRGRPDQIPRSTGMIGMIVAAALVAALVTPALAATQSSRLTADNGGVPVIIDPHAH